MTRSRWRFAAVSLTLFTCAAIVVTTQLPAIGAAGLLHPLRRQVAAARPAACENAIFAGEGIMLKGWHCYPSGIRLGTVVYLHGVADNRASGVGVIDRFVKRGFEVVAYDSRAHGESGGDVCTYGYWERHDVRRVLDQLEPGPTILIGTSLGAAIALAAAAEDSRISAIVAAETFSDLRTVATERAPFFFSPRALARAFELAEERGAFDVDAVSPVNAAVTITAPALLIHGDADVDTPPDHSRRVFAALRGPKRLMIVPGVAHNRSLAGEVWREIEQWIEDVLSRGTLHAASPIESSGSGEPTGYVRLTP